MSETGIWTQDGQVFTTTAREIEKAGGERKVTLPDSSLRVADLEWKLVTQPDGGTCFVKKLAAIPARTFMIRQG